MSSAPLPFFDGIAEHYDETWTNTGAGRMQRNAVWREIDPLIGPKCRVLDLGCGTGEDAAHLSRRGAKVFAIDSSLGMVQEALRKGVNARLMEIERAGELCGKYDLVLSNFGALNCLPDLGALRETLARLVSPGGRLAICVMGRFCLWETLYYALRGKFGKASRRWRGATETPAGLRVYYPTVRQMERELSPSFRLVRAIGVGVCVPPSFVRTPSLRMLDMLDRWDERIAGSPAGRAVSDHRLLVFVR